MLILLTLVDDEAVFAELEENLDAQLSTHRMVSARGAPGIAAGYNELVARAAARPDDILCFVHQDVRFGFDAAAVLPTVVDALDDVGVVGFAGSAAQVPGRPWYDCPPRYGSLMQGAAGAPLRFAACPERADGPPVAEVHTLDGLALVVRAGTLATIGGFDEGCPGWHGYDVDLCLRARRAGLRNYVLDQPVHHHSSGTEDDDHRRSLRWLAERWSAAAIGPMLAPAPERGRAAPLRRVGGAAGADEPHDRLALGHDAVRAGAWGTAIECLAPLVDGPPGSRGRGGGERGVAALLLALAHDAIGAANPVVAPLQASRRRHWLLRAVDESPLQRGPWIELASLVWEHGDAVRTLAATTNALAATEPMPHDFDPPAWAWMLHDLRSLAAWELGDREEAQRHACAALAVDPRHDRLARNHRALARAMGGDGEPRSWRDLEVLVPAAVVHGSRVALIGDSPEAHAYLTSSDPASVRVFGAAEPGPRSEGRFDLVLVESTAPPSSAPVAARHLHRWWAAVGPGGWFCGRHHDPAWVARLTTTMFLRHGVRSAADRGDADDPTVWAMRVPDRLGR